MRFYLAARFSRIDQMRNVRTFLEQAGNKVTSRWINGGHDECKSVHSAADLAIEDIEDIAKSDCIIVFTEEPRTTTGRGGRFVEMGIGIGMKKIVVVIGPRENVFCCHPVVKWYPDFETFKIESGCFYVDN